MLWTNGPWILIAVNASETTCVVIVEVLCICLGSSAQISKTTATKMYRYASCYGAILPKAATCVTSCLLSNEMNFFQKVASLIEKKLLLSEANSFLQQNPPIKWDIISSQHD